METIKSLTAISENDIYEAFSVAFADYELQLDKGQLRTMLIRRGFIPELSFGAFSEGRLVSFTLNGIGRFNGSKTAYDTGTGTIGAFRGKGLASAVFNHSIPFLKEAGVTQYLLEVLQHNTKAVSLYKRLGFKITREFNYFVQEAVKIKVHPRTLPPGLQLRATDLPEIESHPEFLDFDPSWQNSFEAIRRKPGDFHIIGAYLDRELAGYSVFEPGSGDITQLAIDGKHRRMGIATALLEHALKHNQNDSVQAINAETCCEPMTRFLISNGIILKGKQFEMIRKL